jgi:uncharacterized protein (DUF2235 family)
MAKNIVICCDGTGNEFGDHNSNVVKLYSVLIIDGKRQVGYYHPAWARWERRPHITGLVKLGPW